MSEYKSVFIPRRNLESDTAYHGANGWRAVKIEQDPTDEDMLMVTLERD